MIDLEFHQPDGKAIIVPDPTAILFWTSAELGPGAPGHGATLHFSNAMTRDVRETVAQVSEMVRRARTHM